MTTKCKDTLATSTFLLLVSLKLGIQSWCSLRGKSPRICSMTWAIWDSLETSKTIIEEQFCQEKHHKSGTEFQSGISDL